MIDLNLVERQITIQIVLCRLGEQCLSITYWFIKSVLSHQAELTGRRVWGKCIVY